MILKICYPSLVGRVVDFLVVFLLLEIILMRTNYVGHEGHFAFDVLEIMGIIIPDESLKIGNVIVVLKQFSLLL